MKQLFIANENELEEIKKNNQALENQKKNIENMNEKLLKRNKELDNPLERLSKISGISCYKLRQVIDYSLKNYLKKVEIKILNYIYKIFGSFRFLHYFCKRYLRYGKT